MPGPFFLSADGESKLATCTQRIQRVMRIVIVHIDYKVIFGHRGVEIQAQLFADGRTTIDGTTKKSNHNYKPSRAIDIAPYPVLWPDEEGISETEALHRARRFDVLAGIVMGVGIVHGILLRWGGDWNRNWQYNDQRFHDLGHFEEVNPTLP